MQILGRTASNVVSVYYVKVVEIYNLAVDEAMEQQRVAIKAHRCDV